MKKIQWIDKKLYNGSVSAMTWTMGSDTRVRGYKYTYDVNRITTVLEDADPVTQNGSMDYPGVKREMSFEYNEWGALIKDESRGITDISYDRLGNPLRVSFSDGSYTENVYSASGNKLKTTHATALNATVTGRTTTEYRGNLIYRDGKLDMVLFPGGYATVNGTAITFHYYTQDYLGNNRSVINGSTGAIKQTVAYYPYGGVIADLGTNATTVQPYKFGGKELVTANGLNKYDFGARQYYSANEQRGNDHVPTYTLSHRYDRLAKLSHMTNAKNFHTRMDAKDSNTKTEHGIDPFSEEVVKLIREGKIKTSVQY